MDVSPNPDTDDPGPAPAEPIAIVGMACRFAGGVDSPERFWQLLRRGGDVVGKLPEGRWDWYASRGGEHAAAVREATGVGAFLDDIKGFDAEFFGITPREAALMDPQQRITLELAWEALEDAGIPPDRLGGSDTGVFMGVGADDYGRRMLEDLPNIEAWSGIGGAYCGVANRVSHLFDLRGPSVAVDTACSSSLVAIHLAAQALRAGECPVALAGGVLVIAAPGLSLVLDAAGATSPDGRCKSFDAEADGYGRGEGGGVVVLKRLADARRTGDRVLAVLRGSGVHQDGRTEGIMAPSGEAQAHLLRRVYASSGIDPATIGYVEAHGTGTRVGDPMEAAALGAVFAPGRPADRPLLTGSVKPNIGHLEAGAGVASVIKTVLALRHKRIPPSINLTRPNPDIPWDEARLRVVAEVTEWPETHGPRRAGVSAYGYGGTIAHVILEEGDAAPSAPSTPCADRGQGAPKLFPLSGASPAAVQEYASHLAAYLTADGANTDLADVGRTLAVHRTHLTHRAAILAADRGQLVAGLPRPAASGAVVPGSEHGAVWVFSGHGSQWIGMGRELLAAEPVFADVIGRIEPVFAEELGIGPRAVLLDDVPQPVDVIQPMIFAMQVALAAVARARGLRPAAVLGHSVGEIAAAVTAGVFDLEQGARLVCRRSALLRAVAGRGAMAMVNLPAAEAEARLAEHAAAMRSRVARGSDAAGGPRGASDASAAAVNDLAAAVAASSSSCVISGSPAAVAEISALWESEGLTLRPVESDVAFHGPQMDPLLDALASAVTDLTPREPEIPIYTTALEDPRSAARRDGRYWAANLRNQVRLAEGVAAAAEDGYRLFLEISPHPVVAHSITETLDALGIADSFVGHCLRRGRPEAETLLRNFAALYCHGCPVDWPQLWPAGGLVDLPGPAWQRKPHWAEEPTRRSFRTEQHDPAGHALLGGRIVVHGARPARAWLTYLDRTSRPYPGDHPVRGVEIVPAAVLLNTLLGAAESATPADLVDVDLRVPVSLTHPRYLQIVVQDGTVRLSSRIADDEDDDIGWLTHTTAEIEPASPLPAGPSIAILEAAVEELPVGYVAERLAALGVTAMGFPWNIERIERTPSGLVVTAVADPRSSAPPETWAPILDALTSAASVAFPGPPMLRMPAHVDRVTLAAHSPERAEIRVRIVSPETVDVEVSEPGGAVVGRMTGLRFGTVDSDSAPVAPPRQLVHDLTWRPMEPCESATDAFTAVLVGRPSDELVRLVAALSENGVDSRIVADPDELSRTDLGPNHAILVVPTPGTAASATWLLARTAQRLAAAGDDRAARLWVVTHGVREAKSSDAISLSPLWGLGRVLSGEHPEFWGGVIDLDSDRTPDQQDSTTLISLLGSPDSPDVIAIRAGQALVPRLRRVDSRPDRAALSCRPDGTYLITGGLGALGLEAARRLADRGARRLILAGRRGLPPRELWADTADPQLNGKIEAVRALERMGVTVIPIAVDIADAEDCAKRLDPAALGLPPIRGVVHAAGIVDNRLLRDLDEASLGRVLRPKVDGALVVHELFPPGSVEFFVLFSSCGHLLALPGQASYAAANAFLDALAAHRRARGDTGAMSFGWTSWRGLGMSTSSAVIDLELAARGTADITAGDAFAAWDWAERHDLGYAAVLRILPPEPGGLRPKILADLPTDTAAAQAERPSAIPPGLARPQVQALLAGHIRDEVATMTHLAAADVDPRRPLAEMGVDSLMSVQIRRGLERRFRLPLPATLFWDRPSVDAVAAWLAERLAQAAS